MTEQYQQLTLFRSRLTNVDITFSPNLVSKSVQFGTKSKTEVDKQMYFGVVLIWVFDIEITLLKSVCRLIV